VNPETNYSKSEQKREVAICHCRTTTRPHTGTEQLVYARDTSFHAVFAPVARRKNQVVDNLHPSIRVFYFTNQRRIPVKYSMKGLY
jgi:hypothetical protein